jgi:hypothetical protein
VRQRTVGHMPQNLLEVHVKEKIRHACQCYVQLPSFLPTKLSLPWKWRLNVL